MLFRAKSTDQPIYISFHLLSPDLLNYHGFERTKRKKRPDHRSCNSYRPFPSQTFVCLRMAILAYSIPCVNYPSNPEELTEAQKRADLPACVLESIVCPKCGSRGSLRLHKHTSKYHFASTEDLRNSRCIIIPVYRCPCCRSCHSVLPSDSIPFLAYSISFIIRTLLYYLDPLSNHTRADTASHFCISEKTFDKLYKRFKSEILSDGPNLPRMKRKALLAGLFQKFRDNPQAAFEKIRNRSAPFLCAHLATGLIRPKIRRIRFIFLTDDPSPKQGLCSPPGPDYAFS